MDSTMRNLNLDGRRRVSNNQTLPPIRSLLPDGVLPPPLAPNVANAFSPTIMSQQYPMVYNNQTNLAIRQSSNAAARDDYASSSSADSPRNSDFFPTPSSSRRSSPGALDSTRQKRGSGSSDSERQAKRPSKKSGACTNTGPCDCKQHRKIQSERGHRGDNKISLQNMEDLLQIFHVEIPKAQTANNSAKAGLSHDKQQNLDAFFALCCCALRLTIEQAEAFGGLENLIATYRRAAELGIREGMEGRKQPSISPMAAPTPTGDIECPFAKNGVCTEHAGQIFCRKYTRNEQFWDQMGLPADFARMAGIVRPSTSSKGKNSSSKGSSSKRS